MTTEQVRRVLESAYPIDGHDAGLARGNTSSWPEPLAAEALHGVAGKIVRTIEPHTEADPAAILIQTLVTFGNAVGRGPHFMAEADRHGVNLFAVFVGETAKGRKGTSWGHAKRVVTTADPEWEHRIMSGLSSGEGLIWQVRDPIERTEPIKKNGRVQGYETVVVDEGVMDKRLMVFEGEFAAVLRVLARDGNTLSAIIRNAWDSGTLRTLTKNSPARASDAHISIIGHITRGELLRYLDDTEAGNGFGNRFLWACVRRSKILPEGGNLQSEDLIPLADQLRSAIAFAGTVRELRRDNDARAIWRGVYPELSEGRPGLLGAMIAGAEAQVMRLACIYALLDESSVVRQEHLLAALAIWEYCESSAGFVFGSRLGDPVGDEILQALRRTPSGLTRTQIRDLFGRHKRKETIGRALDTLIRRHLARCETEPTGGRDAARFFAAGSPATKATEAT